jgi:hypothetical protein
LANNTVLDYVNIALERSIIKSDIYSLLKDIEENNFNIDLLNNKILNHNNNSTLIMKYNKFCNIIYDWNETHKSYIIFKDFTSNWMKNYNDKEIKLLKFLTITDNSIHSWLMITLLILGTRYHIDESGYISANNLYIQLSEIIKVNVLNKVDLVDKNKEKDEKIKNVIIKIKKDINCYKLHYKIALKIIECAIESNLIIFKKEKKIEKGTFSTIKYYKIEDSILNELIYDIILEKTILPTLIHKNEDIDYNMDYKIDESILISDNHDCHLSVTSKYKKILEYLNSIPISVNKKYLDYLNNLRWEEVKGLTDDIIDLRHLDYSQNTAKDFKTDKNGLTRASIFIINIYIINCFKNHIFHFKHKSDGRGRIYPINWPSNMFNTKLFSPIYLFESEYLIKYNKQYEFDTIFWYNAYKIDSCLMLNIRDATNSIFQISGGILWDIKMLKYTNIHNEDMRYSLYDYILELYKNEIFKK